jgi:hypothetical protein
VVGRQPFPYWITEGLLTIPPIQLGISVGITDLQVPDYKGDGGERGIRTPDTRKGIHAFEARAFSHSAISPHR